MKLRSAQLALAGLALLAGGEALAACEPFAPVLHDPARDTQLPNLTAALDLVSAESCYDAATDELVYTLNVADLSKVKPYGSWWIELTVRDFTFEGSLWAVLEAFRAGNAYHFRIKRYVLPLRGTTDFTCHEGAWGRAVGNAIEFRVLRSRLEEVMGFATPPYSQAVYRARSAQYLSTPALACGGQWIEIDYAE